MDYTIYGLYVSVMSYLLKEWDGAWHLQCLELV